MTRDDIIRMAREAGIDLRYEGASQLEFEYLEHFAELVAAELHKSYNETFRKDRRLNPGRWKRNMSEAWNRELPDVYKAFEALRNCPEE